jgi:hypothetical protein
MPSGIPNNRPATPASTWPGKNRLLRSADSGTNTIGPAIPRSSPKSRMSPVDGTESVAAVAMTIAATRAAKTASRMSAGRRASRSSLTPEA